MGQPETDRTQELDMFEVTKPAVEFSLVVPTFNERDNLIPLVERVQKTLSGRAYELIIVDDDSPDKTWHVAEEMARQDSRLRVIRRQGERGLATAVVAGWKVARGTILGVMDGDLQYPPEFLPQLLNRLEGMGADLAVASRYVSGATVVQWSLLRKINSWGARLLTRLALPSVSNEIQDPGAGCFVMQRRVINNVELRPIGYKILLEVLARGHYNTVVEMPHDYQGRKEGQSKLDVRQHIAFLSHLRRLSSETGEFRRLMRCFVVELSGVCLALGSLLVLREVYGLHYLYAASIATECAIANNYFWNEVWTFADKTDGTLLHRLKRFLKFNKICVGGALLTLGALWVLTETAGIYYLVSALAGFGAAIVWNHNFHVKDTWVTRQAQPSPSSLLASSLN
jgi:dolichol-phosphate mannosyltransferase